MLNTFAIKAINLLLQANPNTQNELQKYATKVVTLELPLMTLQFIIASDGSLEAETTTPDCTIKIPLAASSHLIHHDEVKTYRSLEITGDKTLAKDLLTTLASIETTNVLYLSQNPVLNIFAHKLEQLITSIVSYAKLVANNATFSTSQYLQYEVALIANKYEIDEFCTLVDELRERCDLLSVRVNKLTNK